MATNINITMATVSLPPQLPTSILLCLTILLPPPWLPTIPPTWLPILPPLWLPILPPPLTLILPPPWLPILLLSTILLLYYYHHGYQYQHNYGYQYYHHHISCLAGSTLPGTVPEDQTALFRCRLQ